MIQNWDYMKRKSITLSGDFDKHLHESGDLFSGRSHLTP